MKPIPDSGFLYPNLFVRIMLLSVEDVAGVNGVKAILNMAGQRDLIGNYPPMNMDKGIDIARYSMIMAAIDNLYGDKGGQILAMRAGNANFQVALKMMGEIPGFSAVNSEDRSIEERAEAGLCLVRTVITGEKATSIPRTEDGQFLYAVKNCPICLGRTTTTPRCYLTAGLLQGAMRWATGGLEFNVKHVRSHSCGNPTCDYIIPLTPMEK
mgnify:CR=1 FL=1